VIRDLAPDLVAFQEAALAPDEDQASDLLGPAYHVVHGMDRGPKGTGIAVGARWPILRRADVDLHLTPRSADPETDAVLVEVDAPAPFGPVVFANHFPSWQTDRELEREVQAVAVARAIEAFATSDQPVIVAGDLDADRDAASMRFWTGHQSLDGLSIAYRDAWEAMHPGIEGPEAATYTPDNPWHRMDWLFRRIDHILVRLVRGGVPSLTIRACERAFDEPIDGVYASDHFALVADLVPRPIV
jgi:endonuclease/exonuclease/phosphatase family metal-dependent hydrolase